MTEQEAIERIEQAITAAYSTEYDTPLSYDLTGFMAKAAWNEMKAIAREDNHVAPKMFIYHTGATLTDGMTGKSVEVRDERVRPSNAKRLSRYG